MSFLSLIPTFLPIIVGIITIITKLLNLQEPLKRIIRSFKLDNTIARNDILNQIKRGNAYFSYFFKNINPLELKLPLRRYAHRTLSVLLYLAITIVVSVIFTIFFGPLWKLYPSIAFIILLFVFAILNFFDDFTFFILKKDGEGYSFTTLKRTISRFLFILEQSIMLIELVIIAFVLSLLLYDPADPFSAFQQSVYIDFILFVFVIALGVVIIKWESNIKKQLEIWAFSKFITEEDARIHLRVNLEGGTVIGYLSGIGTNLELKVETNAHMEIPWKSVKTVTIDENVECIQSKTESIDDFFLRLKGKRIKIANLHRVDRYEVFSDYGLHKFLMEIFKAKLEKYFYERVSPELMDYVIDDWIVTNLSGKRVLELKPDIKEEGFIRMTLTIQKSKDMVIIDQQEFKSYKVINLDLMNIRIEYKEIR